MKGKIFLALISLLVLLVSVLYYYRTTQNNYIGTIKVSSPYLVNEATIQMDQYGFTHIRAQNRMDAMFTIGVAHARDRLWQMEFMRRLATGTLSEILGEKTLPIDKISRDIGFRRAAENDVLTATLDRNHRTINGMLSRYVEGINWYANSYKLPIEFYLLNINWKNWTVVDSLSCVRLFSFSMTLDHPNELLNTLVHDILGQEYYDILYKSTIFEGPFSNITTLTKEEITMMGLNATKPVNIKGNFNYKAAPEIKVKHSSIRESPIEYEKNEEHASNSWVVHGNYTKSGKPLFSNDPHLTNEVPNTHYIIKLYITDTNEVITGSFPAISPFMIIGSNKHHAYGLTTDNRDVSDFVEERLDNPDIDKAKYYYVDNEKKRIEEIYETIKIKGKDPIDYEVKKTRNGPLIRTFIKEFCNSGLDYTFKPSDSSDGPNAISLNIFSFHKPLDLYFFYNIMFGTKKEDFLPHLSTYEGPSFAFSWANINGEIGYTPIGHFANKINPTQVFAKGYSSEYKGYYDMIPRNETPVYTNPKKGFIATANNYPFPSNYKYFSTHYSYHTREKRITDLLNKKLKSGKKYSIEDAIEILSDTKDLTCDYFKPTLVKILESKADKFTEKERNNLELLKKFDCDFNKNSEGATFFAVFEYKLMQYIVLKNPRIEVGFKNKEDVRGLFTVHSMFFMLYNILTKSENKNLPTCSYFEKGHNCDDFVVDVFKRMDKFLEELKFIDGKTKKIKKWSEVHFHYYNHQFAKNNILKKIFSRSVSTNGNRNTVKVAKTKYSMDNPFTSTHSANLKYINDLSDITRPYLCLDTGNSGNILSKFYDNLMVQCEENKLIKIEDVDFDKSKSLNLVPGNK